MRVTFTPIASNKKTGPIPVTTTERASCWTGCRLHQAGCYAELGPIRFVWDATESSTLPWRSMCEKVAALPRATLWRHNQAGDLPGVGPRIDPVLLQQLVDANAGKGARGRRGRKRGFTFTHKPVLGASPIAAENRTLIAEAVNGGFTINLSGDNPVHADWLAELKIAPVVTVLPSEYGRRRGGGRWLETIAQWRERTATLPKHTPGGRRLALCPESYTDTTCLECGACARPRQSVIGFPAHGTMRKKVDALARKTG